MEREFTPEDLVLLFGTTISTSLLQEAMARLKPIPQTPTSTLVLETHSASNVRRFLKHIFPKTVFAARYSRDAARGITTLKVSWPLFPQSPSSNTVQEVLSPFMDMPMRLLSPTFQHSAVAASFRQHFGGVPCIGFWPHDPEKSDVLALSNRRQDLLATSLVGQEASPRVNKPRM